MTKKQTEETILDDFRQVHGTQYRYPQFPESFMATSPIDIICPLHGNFKLRIHYHKLGRGCPQCKKENNKNRFSKQALDRSEWIKRFESLHGRGKYDYSRIGDYVLHRKKIEIYCPEHNITFYQSPEMHWRFGRGCPKCGIVKHAISLKQKLIDRREYELRARLVHGDAFEYSELPQKFSLNDNIIIYCNEHEHIFFCIAQEHLNGKRCSLTCIV